jgi:hypothetical protein
MGLGGVRWHGDRPECAADARRCDGADLVLAVVSLGTLMIGLTGTDATELR